MQCFCFPFSTLWPFICWSANNISPIRLSSVHHKKNFEDTVLFFFFLLHLIQSRIYNSDISSIDRWNLSNCLSNIDSKHLCLDCNQYISSSLSKNEKSFGPQLQTQRLQKGCPASSSPLQLWIYVSVFYWNWKLADMI